jgi:hypothetical protein
MIDAACCNPVAELEKLQDILPGSAGTGTAASAAIQEQQTSAGAVTQGG